MLSKHSIVVAVIAGLSVAVSVSAESVGDRLHKGIYQEETVGDLQKAITIYRQIVTDERANRPHVAQAKFRLGICYLKKGDKRQAIETLEKLIVEFPGQPNVIEQARGLLSVLRQGASSGERGIQLQDVWAYSGLADLDVLTISRDGRYCAFVDEIGGIKVRDLKNDVDQRVAETAPKGGESANWQRASISPDNKWMSYVGRVSDPKPRSCVRIAALDGSNQRVLYSNQSNSVIRDLEWSPDSQQVLATLVDTRGNEGVFATVPIRIATISLADGSLRLLKTLAPEERHGVGPKPQFSPDGRYVAYAKIMDESSQQEDIYLIPLDGGPEIHLIEHPADDDVLGWMPDGRGLVFRSDRGGDGRDAWLVRLINGMPTEAPQLVATGIGPDLEGPVRTPTGSWAFYYSDVQAHQRRDVLIAEFDSENGRIVGEPKPASERFPGDTYLWPGWSPDGKYLAYHADSRKPGSVTALASPRSLVIRSTQTGRERAIELGESRVPGQVAWSPDGRSIILSSEWGHFAPLNKIDVESGASTPIGSPAVGGRVASSQTIGWSADGNAVYLTRNHADTGLEYKNGQILRLNLETGQERELHLEKNDGIFACALSPDGAHIALAGPEFDWKSVRVLPTTGGEPRELCSVPAQENILDHVTWSHDGRYVLFWKVRRPEAAGQESRTERKYRWASSDSRYELWRIGVEGGEPEKLGWETPAKIRGLRIHSSGKQVAFTTERPPGTRNHIRMMQLSPEWAKESCIANMKMIGEALHRYEHDHGALPNHLSDLYPDYLQDSSLLVCAAHDERQPTVVSNDPEMPSSYDYVRGGAPRFSYLANSQLPTIVPDGEMARAKVLELRVKYFGDIAGLVECEHHHPNLQLTYEGEVQEARSWGSDGRADQGLLSQLQTAMETNPQSWLEDYDIPKFVTLLEDRAALPELLNAHIKAQPGNESASAKQAMDDLQRVRFIDRSEDDANELADGQIELNSDNIDLVGDENDGNRAIGLRFRSIPVPQGARIKRAYVQFESNAWGTWGNEGLIFHGELTGNAMSFKNVEKNITTRPKTVTSVKCSPKIWDWRSVESRTSDLASVIQEITSQPDWHEGNALVLIVTGSSQGMAISWDWDQGHDAPMLYVEVE